MDSERWKRPESHGARTQRLLFGSTSAKAPGLPPTFYVDGLVAPFTIDTMPDQTLPALAESGETGAPMPADGGDRDAERARIAAAGVDLGALATHQLQGEGAEPFTRSSNGLLQQIERTGR
jgi:transaldolase